MINLIMLKLPCSALHGNPFRFPSYLLTLKPRRQNGFPIGDCEAFGGLGVLAEDRNYVSTKAKLLIAISVWLKKLSVFARPLIHLADSVYVVSSKQ
jgi:hypothetical protein